jgi:hypothetical protein
MTVFFYRSGKRLTSTGVWVHMDVKPGQRPAEGQGLAAEFATAGVMLLGVAMIVAGLTVISWQGSLGWLGVFLGIPAIALALLNRRWLALALLAAAAVACLAGFAQAVSHWN